MRVEVKDLSGDCTVKAVSKDSCFSRQAVSNQDITNYCPFSDGVLRH